MASGYDRRQPTRDTFAFQPVTPAQAQPQNSGQRRGAQIVGGETRGGAVASGPQTDASPIGAGLGAFVEQFMEPHIQRRQQEDFFKGFTAAQSGVAIDEISKSEGGFAKVFGPTSFEQGAAFYTAKSRVDQWQTERMSEIDTLKRLPDADRAKLLADTSRDLMTGNAATDQLIQSAIVELGGPLMNTVAKARYAWQQDEAKNAFTSAAATGATALQGVAVEQAKLSAPSDESRAAFGAQMTSFVRGLAKPEGMSDEAYQSGLFDFMRGAMQDGNFYAVEAMHRAGIDKVFSEEDQVKLADAYQRYGNKVLGRAAMTAVPELMRLDARIAREEDISPLEVGKILLDVNNRLKRQTGLDLDLFDYADIRGGARSATEALMASFRRREQRRWQLEDRQQDRAWKLEDDQREEQQNAAQVQAIWGIGSVKTGIAMGLKDGDFDILAINEYRAGNVTNIANAFNREGWVSGKVAGMMRARITATVGKEYNKDFQTAYGEWQSLNKASPGAAQGYYGKYFAPMQKFDGLVRGGLTPQVAYVRAFGDPAAYSIERVPPERRKAVGEAVAATIDANEPWTVFGMGFGTPLNESSKRVLSSALTNEVAIQSQNSDLPDEQLTKNAYDALFAAGKAERYGAFAWRTKQGTVPFSRLLKLQPKEAERVVTSVIDKQLRAAGFADGADGDNYEITRINDEKGRPSLWVQGFSDDGNKGVLIGLADFQSEAQSRRGGQVPVTKPPYKGPDPYRRIPGEKGWQRTARINREVAAGADPVNHFNNRTYGAGGPGRR